MILSTWVKNNVLDLATQKGFYPYEYMSDLKKFKEQLPNKEKFYSSLTSTNIHEKEFEMRYKR